MSLKETLVAEWREMPKVVKGVMVLSLAGLTPGYLAHAVGSVDDAVSHHEVDHHGVDHQESEQHDGGLPHDTADFSAFLESLE